jgi:WD40 repeat protein
MDRRSGDRKAVLRAGTGKSGTDVFVLSLAFSPDGKRLAAGTSENIVTVWDVATGEVVSRWPSRKKGSLRSLPKALIAASGVYGLCFNQEGTRVAAETATASSPSSSPATGRISGA